MFIDIRHMQKFIQTTMKIWYIKAVDLPAVMQLRATTFVEKYASLDIFYGSIRNVILVYDRTYNVTFSV